MRFFYTLIASGLLILTEIPAEQPPPFDSYQDVPYAVSHELGTTAPHDQAVNFDGTREVFFDPSGEWYIDSSPTTYLGAPEYLFPTQLKQTTFAARVPPEVERGRLQDGPELLPLDLKVSPTPQAEYRQQSSLPITGYAMFYNPNVMQEVLSNRLAMGHVSACGECIGNVALLRAGDLNRRVWLQWPDGVVEGPFLVADVAASHHVTQLLARNWVVDVDNRTAVRRRMAGPVLVTVWGSPPPASQLEMPPFSPLYSEMAPANLSATKAPLSAQTPTPTVTPLPALTGATPIASAIAQGGFPTETPIPSITPLPVINATATATVATQATAASTQTPLPTQTLAPTYTPVPLLSPPVTTSVVLQGGFPTDTPVPTITPLPAIDATQTPVATTTPTVTAIVAQTSSMTATLVVTQGGFPTDTPVPTITPLPAINPPTPTVFTN